MYKIIKYEQLNSTNKFALENINSIDKNTVIQAEIQTAGRGRFARKWISDKKNNCYISFVLKPDLIHKTVFPNLTQYLSIVLCKELTKYGLCPNIKWPNDVQINGKKIAGILSEAAFSHNKFDGIVLGIGVNLNLDETDLQSVDIPATSLNLEVKSDVNSSEFIDNIVESFFKKYDTLLENNFKYFRAEYISYCNFVGKEIKIKNPELQNIGTAINVSEDGTLEILTPSGEIKKILSGDMII